MCRILQCVSKNEFQLGANITSTSKLYCIINEASKDVGLKVELISEEKLALSVAACWFKCYVTTGRSISFRGNGHSCNILYLKSLFNVE